jgi:hypothetical protein
MLPTEHPNVSQESAMKNARVSLDPEAARLAAAYATRAKAIDYVMGKLAAVTKAERPTSTSSRPAK